MKFLGLLFILSVWFHQGFSSQYQYACPSAFMESADFVFGTKRFDPNKIQKGDIVFVDGYSLKTFFEGTFPRIKSPFILVSHNSDITVPGAFISYADDPKIIGWFGENMDNGTHPKLHQLPIGLNHHSQEKITIFENFKWKQKAAPSSKKYLLYLNYRVETNVKERGDSLALLAKQPFSYACTRRKELKKYFEDVASSKFVLSPRGAGEDCYRTWEALSLGSIPIVKSSFLNPLYEGLPVVIVQEWSEITEEFLNQKWEEIQAKQFNLEKLSGAYWINLISSCKNQ